ncbi:MAG: hypothetical protein ACRDZ1_13240 [Acidimicrobiia bacterium]
MASLETRRRPNVLTAEALALALLIDGTIAVTVDAPLLREGARDLGITYRVTPQLSIPRSSGYLH